MRVIVCDRCGEQTSRLENCVTIEFPIVHLGEPQELHLCYSCSKALTTWVKGEPEEERHDYSTEIPF